MANEGRILVYFDDLVNTLARQYSSTIDTHIYSPRDILSSIQGISPVDAVEVAEYDAIVSKLENLLCHATGGKYSKAGYSWEDMERMVTDYIEECCEEAVAEAVVHGRWEESTSVDHMGRIVEHGIDCSVCDSVFKDKSREVVKRWKERFEHCPFCGAKMDGDGNA